MHQDARPAGRRPVYTPEERRRRDASPWTIVQRVLVLLQPIVCLVGAWLIVSHQTP
jgi:3-vinyl bacteriochlorophyllide hydratase